MATRANLNRVTLIGNVGSDPEVESPAHRAVVRFWLATHTIWFQRGKQHEGTTWHRIAAGGRLAAYAAQYVRRGQLYYVEGALHRHRWTDTQGVGHERVEIEAHLLIHLGDPGGGSGTRPSSPDDRPAASGAEGTAPNASIEPIMGPRQDTGGGPRIEGSERRVGRRIQNSLDTAVRTHYIVPQFHTYDPALNARQPKRRDGHFPNTPLALVAPCTQGPEDLDRRAAPGPAARSHRRPHRRAREHPRGRRHRRPDSGLRGPGSPGAPPGPGNA